MSTNLSPVGGAAAQFLDNNGNPLTGGKLYTYEAGTTTPQATYTTFVGNVAHANPIILDSAPLTGGKLYTYDAGTTTPQATYTTSAGNVAHANPIILNAAGRVPGGEIWLTASLDYKFSLFTSADVLIATWDNIVGINGTGIATNANAVAYDPAGSGAVQRTVESKLRDVVSVKDFGAVGNGFANDTDAIQAAIDFVWDNGSKGGTVYIPQGTYKSGKLLFRTKTIIRGAGAEVSKLDFSLSSDYGFYLTGGVSNFAHGAGLYDLRIEKAPSHNFYLDNTVGGGVGESFYIDRVQSYNAGGDGLNFSGDSTPLHLGHISVHGNAGAGLRFVNESQGHVQVIYVAGDNNGESLVTIENVGSNSNINIIGWKSERWSASQGHSNIFRIVNAQGGFVHIGSGRYTSQLASAPNAIVLVESGNSIRLLVDPISAGDGLVTDYTYGIQNLITGATRTPAQILRNIYTTCQINADTNFSGGGNVAWQNFRNSIGTVPSGNTLRFNHASDGASTTANVEFYNNTTLVGSLSGGGTLRLASALQLGGTASSGFPILVTGAGSPESVITAVVGSLYLRTNGGANTTLYVKESGTGNTGWVAK